MAHQHILGCLVPYHGMVDLHKKGYIYNQGYLATIKYKLEILRLNMGMHETVDLNSEQVKSIDCFQLPDVLNDLYKDNRCTCFDFINNK